MRHEESLRRRILWAYVVLAFVLCMGFAAVAFLTIRAIEHQSMYKRFAAEAAWVVARHRDGKSIELRPGTQLFHGSGIPQEMRSLPPGVQEVMMGERDFLVVTGVDDGGRWVVIDDQSDFARIERNMIRALGAGFLASLLLAVLLGRATVSLVIAPVTALAEAVERDADEGLLPSRTAVGEIGVLARAFAARTSELRRFLVRERLFTGDVSHELRTPLTVILGAAELLVAQNDDRPAARAAAERLRRAALDATELVSALLLLSRSPDRLDAPRIALRPLLEREWERCQPLLTSKRVTLRMEADDEVWVFARPELAAIAIGNLIRNACQYAEQGEVTVRVIPGALVVEDTGPGLPEPVRARLFGPWVRARDEEVAGSGLGLALVKRVVEHLGWELRLEDGPEGGSQFILAFPTA